MADQEEVTKSRDCSNAMMPNSSFDFGNNQNYGSENPRDCDPTPRNNMILTEKEVTESLQISERIMEESKGDECDPYFISLADVMVKLAAATLEVKKRIERKYPDDHFPLTEPFASPSEERHAESMEFLDHEFKMFAECFVFLVRAYMSLTSEKINILSQVPNDWAKGDIVAEDVQVPSSTQGDGVGGKEE
ncbi:Dicarboxylic amino acid permease [Penicillium atrosanguineum]|uniref:Uncharacterized protein n=1 Tax=Penicillium atrosanguineum TaxID=1132637 RepID=A0A9W9U491_9EURO|nr:Dicarboxylic amino acid permease [Penicillium atrosanguineum]KAJ5122703.1 hypothetical protein N7526_009640 [Penicillium atrosanguineum]KAJ5310342.1 Dicarboxylic amino acid permease [Penicillium atrosanguineum]KAJ5315861.1 hypothetical protein N7476_006168 [Penicillium atrosanguineum]